MIEMVIVSEIERIERNMRVIYEWWRIWHRRKNIKIVFGETSPLLKKIQTNKS